MAAGANGVGADPEGWRARSNLTPDANNDLPPKHLDDAQRSAYFMTGRGFEAPENRF